MIIVFCGSVMVVVGLIVFIGLMMLYMVCWLVGVDYCWLLFVMLFVIFVLLLFVDIIGWVIVFGELCVFVVSVFIGVLVLIFFV